MGLGEIRVPFAVRGRNVHDRRTVCILGTRLDSGGRSCYTESRL